MDLVQLAPARIVQLFKMSRRPLYVASDARLDEESPASLAVLIYDPENQQKVGLCARLPADLIDKWSSQF